MSDKELIAEARDRAAYMKLLAAVTENSPGAARALEEADRMTRLADALEAATRERDAAPDAATEELCADEMTANEAIGLVLKRPGMYGLVPLGEHRSVKAERDAALAAIERVRAVHRKDARLADWPVCAHCTVGMLQDPVDWPCETIAALDGAPEPAGLPVEGEKP